MNKFNKGLGQYFRASYHALTNPMARAAYRQRGGHGIDRRIVSHIETCQAIENTNRLLRLLNQSYSSYLGLLR